MGRKSNHIKELESIGRYSFKLEGDVYRIRKRPGPTSKLFFRDSRFFKTRRQNLIFKNYAETGKLLRAALSPFIDDISTADTKRQFVKLLSQLRNLDREGGHYKSMQKGLESEEGRKLFCELKLGSGKKIKEVLLKPLEIRSNHIHLKDLIVKRDLCLPEETSHVVFKAGRFNVDLDNKKIVLTESKGWKLPVNEKTKNRVLRIPELINDSGESFYIFKISFLRNGLNLKKETVVQFYLG
jgi:hypothetical protein